MAIETSLKRDSKTGLAYEISGSGPVLVFLHGWPFHKGTFDKLIACLSKDFTCIAVDAAGMGDSVWSGETDFGFTAHAKRLNGFIASLQLEHVTLIAHDTGATITRIAATEPANRISQLVLMDTEIPEHRPAFIPLYQKIMGLPLSRLSFALLLSTNWFYRSRFGFKHCFFNPEKLNEDFRQKYALYWTQSDRKLKGLILYLQGIDFGLVDRLNTIQSQITASTLVIWGKEDRIFPVVLARKMALSIPHLSDFVTVEGAGFLVHEEKPEEVAREIGLFLSGVQKDHKGV